MNRLTLLAITLLGFLRAEAQEFRPNLGPDLPSITVHAGDLTILLRQSSQWTPGRIDFRGQPMTTEKSAYGTVLMFPEIGFVGTAHLENEPENLQSLAFHLDGRKIDSPTSELTGDSFRFERVSIARGIGLENTIEIRDHRLYETAVVRSPEETPLKLVYHFMHAWVPTVSAYLAGSDGAPEEAATELIDDESVDRKFYIQKSVDWSAVYEPESGQFAVSRLLESPEGTDSITKIWNVVGTYRKFYLQSFTNASLPAGFHGTWRIVTAFGTAAPDDWEDAARQLAEELREPGG